MVEDSNDVSQDPWLVGNQYGQMIGQPPSSFSTLIRGLLADKIKNSDQISFHQEQAMLRFLRGESMKAPFYYALKTFKSGLLQGSPIPLKQVVQSFSAYELSAFLGLLYTFRRARALVKNETEWEFLRRLVITRSEIGALVGYSMPQIGPALGTIAGGLRFLGFVPFIIHDQKGFTEYRRHLKKEDLLTDYKWEMARWGCTHGHVATQILISLAFDRETAMELGSGMLEQTLPEEKNSKVRYAVKLVEIWTSALMETGKEPALRHSGNFYPVAAELSALLAGVARSNQAGSQYYWLEKGKADISPHDTPEFITAEQNASAP